MTIPLIDRHLRILDTLRALGRAVSFSDREGLPTPRTLTLPPHDFLAMGHSGFCKDHGLAFPLYAGAMAGGISSVALVEGMARAGMTGFFGSGGLSPEDIRGALARLRDTLGGLPFGCNLLNSPGNRAWEAAVVRVCLEEGVRCVEASAYITPSPELVLYRVKGLRRLPNGGVEAPNRVIAKLSRTEVASRFFAPPPEKALKALRAAGEITEEEAVLAAEIPLAQDITAEADSGGHTDHRAALCLLPSLLALRDEMQARYPQFPPLRVGLAGGIATPHAVAAAFALGADYVVTGSVNQACRESGTSDTVRRLLAEAAQTHVCDAPAADMFELGASVQVLKRGTRFAERAGLLRALYTAHASLEELPAKDREHLERVLFRKPLETVWAETESFFRERDPGQVEKALQNPRHRMALVFRWYLGMSSKFATLGTEDRTEDCQIWCGPAMGAFNDWVRGSFMESPDARSAPEAALNILFHAAVLQRAAVLRAAGIPFRMAREDVAPLPREEIMRLLAPDKETDG